MNVNVNHNIPKLKHSETLGLVGTISNTIYQIMTGIGIEGAEAITSATYVIAILSNTGSNVLEKWEKSNEENKE